MSGMSQPLPASEFRVSDADRALVETRLRRAVEVGQLDVRDFDQRAALTWAARTRGDLDAVTRDLGELPPPASAPAGAGHARQGTALDRWFADSGGGTAMKVLTIIWACAFAASTAAWIAVCVSTSDLVHPWPLWQLPSGAVLATLYVLGIGRPRP